MSVSKVFSFLKPHGISIGWGARGFHFWVNNPQVFAQTCDEFGRTFVLIVSTRPTNWDAKMICEDDRILVVLAIDMGQSSSTIPRPNNYHVESWPRPSPHQLLTWKLLYSCKVKATISLPSFGRGGRMQTLHWAQNSHLVQRIVTSLPFTFFYVLLALFISLVMISFSLPFFVFFWTSPPIWDLILLSSLCLVLDLSFFLVISFSLFIFVFIFIGESPKVGFFFFFFLWWVNKKYSLQKINLNLIGTPN